MDQLSNGLFLRAEFLSLVPGRPWTGKDGVEHQPHLVRFLAGDRTYQVEYPDEQSALVAAGHAERGDVIEVQVFARAKGKDWLAFIGRRAA